MIRLSFSSARGGTWCGINFHSPSSQTRRFPINRRAFASAAAAAPAEAAKTEKDGDKAPSATPAFKRGPTPRRSRIKFTPETLAKRMQGWKLQQTWDFWARYHREQLRAEFDEKLRFMSEKEEKKRTKKETAIRENLIKRAAYQKIENRLKEERERIATLSAEVAQIKAEINKFARREWLTAMNEDVGKWNKLPEELKNHKLIPQRKTIYHDGMN